MPLVIVFIVVAIIVVLIVAGIRRSTSDPSEAAAMNYIKQADATENTADKSYLLSYANLEVAKQLGPMHPNVVACMWAVAEQEMDRGTYDKAEKLLLEALNITHALIERLQVRKMLIIDRHYPEPIIESLARLYKTQKRYEEAESRLLQLLEIREEDLKTPRKEGQEYLRAYDRESVMDVLKDLVEVCRAQGKTEDAAKYSAYLGSLRKEK